MTNINYRKIIGFHPIFEAKPGQLVTQAFILCSICGTAISSNMGPQYGAICPACTKNVIEGNIA